MITIDGVERWTLAEVGAFFAMSPQQVTMRIRQGMAGHPRANRVPGYNDQYFVASELRDWVAQYMRLNPGKMPFGHVMIPVALGLVPGATLAADGEQALARVWQDWLMSCGAGRRDAIITAFGGKTPWGTPAETERTNA